MSPACRNRRISSSVASLPSSERIASFRYAAISGSSMQPFLFWSYLSKTMLTVLRISSSLPIIFIVNMESDTFTVILGDHHFAVHRKVADISQYFHNILSLGIDQDQIEIDPEIVDKETFDSFLQFCSLNDYSEPVVARKIRTNNLQEVLDKKNYEFIKEFPIQSIQLTKLQGAAHFLVCRGLKMVIAAVYACLIYFQDTKEAYLNKKKELGIPEGEQVTFEDEQRYEQDYYIQGSVIE